MLARAVVHAPELLVLDEPFSGLDASWQRRMTELLRHWVAQGRTLVLATHSPEHMDNLLSHGIILEQGRCLAADEWAGLREHSAFTALFDAPGQLRSGS